MHVIQIEPHGRGGLAHYVANLSGALAEQGHQVSVLTARDYELREQVPARVHLLNVLGAHGDAQRRWSARLQALRQSITAARIARKLRPDAVHVHNTHPLVLIYVALLRLCGLFVVHTAHNVTPHQPVRFERLIYRLVYRWSHRLIVHTEVDAERLRTEFGVAPSKLAIIPHGSYGFFSAQEPGLTAVQARQRLELEQDAEVVLFFGYIKAYKGLDVLMDAWPAVQAARPKARLLVAGEDGDLSEQQQQELRIRASDLGAKTAFGYVPFKEVHLYFRASDCLALPYRKIGQSGVLLAGLALGLPVVASKVGDWDQMLGENNSAMMVETGSSDSLASALIKVLSDAALRDRLVAGGLRLSESYAWPAIAQQTEALLRDE